MKRALELDADPNIPDTLGRRGGGGWGGGLGVWFGEEEKEVGFWFGVLVVVLVGFWWENIS